MTFNRTRLAGIALLIGGILTIVGYAAANAIAGPDGDARFTNPLFVPLYAIALAGDLLTLLGLPAILIAHGERAHRLTNVGFVGVFLAIAMLNIGEGTTEAFVKPYLVGHGGIPESVAGFDVFIGLALLFLAIGLIGLGVAVIRARVFRQWIGALLLISLPLSVVQPPWPFAELGDYLAFLALAAIGAMVAFGDIKDRVSAPDRLPDPLPTA